MATNEEILNSRIIGFIEPVLNSDNARVTVVGYKGTDGEYVALDKSKARAVFYPDGKVFAPKFQFDREGYNVSPNSFVEFSVRTSLKDASFRGDEYIMDYAGKITAKTFTSILTIKYQTSLESGFITQDELSSCIDKSELNNYSGYFFLRSGDYLYGLFKYEASTDSIRPVKGKETNTYEIDNTIYPEYCVKVNQKEYFIGNLNSLPFNQAGIIDCMDDKQLGEWFKEQLKSCAAAESLLSIKKEVFKDFATKFKETNDVIDEIRLERAKGKLDSLEFTFKEIKELIDSNSSLTQILNETLKQMKDEYQSSWASTLEASKDALNKEIESLKKTKDTLKAETESIEAKYSEKEKALLSSFNEKKEKLDEITENYDSILAEMKAQVSQTTKVAFDCIEIEPIEFDKAGDTYTKLEEEDGYGFFNLLKKNLELDEIPEVVKNQLNKNSILFTNRACFVPSVSWAYLYAKAIRNSKLYNIHVEHDWLHYKDFMNNGIASVLASCYENEDVNHVLILDSLNLTQPECGLQPLLDVIAGYSLIIPGIGKPFPKNLKVFATIQSYSDENRIGLPLNNDNFSSWGRIASVDDKLLIESNILECEENFGYFEPKDLSVKSFNDNSDQVDNGYFN